MRLRIEPTINISDQVRVRTMFDIFDNLVLGTTPNSLINPSEYSPNQPQSPTPLGQTTSAAPTDILSTTQNSYASSVLAKWVWAEIDSELGSLRFGRMPWHFGRGMYFNDGECADCDSADGTTVDRFMALTTIYGHQLALAWDIAAEGYDIGYTNLGQNAMGEFPLDLSQKNDVTQLMASLTKVDDDKTWREHINAGEVRVNYGAQLVYRSQDYATFNITPATDSTFASTGNPTTLSANDLGSSLQTNVNALLFITSLWFKLGWKALTLEAEGTLLAGKMGNAGPLRYDAPATDPGAHILQAGWVLASQLKLYGDSLFIGFENGGATGENAETAYTAQGEGYVPYLNYNWQFVPLPKGEKNPERLSLFPRLSRGRDPVPPHHGHGQQCHLLQAEHRLLARPRFEQGSRDWHIGQRHLQPGPGTDGHPGPLRQLRHRDGPGAAIPQPPRQLLRRLHLGRLLAHGGAQPQL